MSVAPVIVAATAKHTATVIFLHGLGDTGHGWASAIAAIRPPYAKVICPTAPSIKVTLNSGLRMPAWFDLRSLDEDSAEDEPGIKKAAEGIHALINAEINAGIPAERIVVGGFSQGGTLALYSSVTFPKKIGGVMALSCWLPLHKQFPGYVKENKDTDIFHCHGDCDPIVPLRWGQLSASHMRQHLKKVDFRTYKGLGHCSNDEEMADLRSFLEKVLPPV